MSGQFANNMSGLGAGGISGGLLN
jgi:hypothetical protein